MQGSSFSAGFGTKGFRPIETELIGMKGLSVVPRALDHRPFNPET